MRTLEPMEVSVIGPNYVLRFLWKIFDFYSDQTPLHIAASVSNCREMAMTLMLNREIQPKLVNNSNETAADIARRTGLTFPVFEMAHSSFVDNVQMID